MSFTSSCAVPTGHPSCPLDTKHGRLEMTFSLNSEGTSILSHLYRKVPMIVQQALYFDEYLPTLPCVYILSSGGPTLEGDHYSVGVELEADTMAHISTGAATLIASMEGGRAEMHQHISLHSGAYLEWLPQPLIPGAGSHYRSSTRVTIAEGATLFWSEVVACGRRYSGEHFDYRRLELSTTIERPNKQLLVCEALALEPRRRSPEEWALLGGFSHFASIVVIAPEGHSRRLYDALGAIRRPDLEMSPSLLQNGCGLAIRALANGSEPLLGLIRQLCSRVRQEIKGVPLQSEFPWRGGATTHNNLTL